MSERFVYQLEPVDAAVLAVAELLYREGALRVEDIVAELGGEHSPEDIQAALSELEADGIIELWGEAGAIAVFDIRVWELPPDFDEGDILAAAEKRHGRG